VEYQFVVATTTAMSKARIFE
ncbi:hypothetical protein Tco_1527428, partial [Tanacetum coccineum]